jgi:mono/diheme cytochrome c family protein
MRTRTTSGPLRPVRLSARLSVRLARAALVLSVVGVAFVVGAAMPAAPASTVAPRTAMSDSLAVNAVVYQGWKMFEVYCTRCHGEDAVGSSFAPALKHSVGPDGSIDHKAFWLTVTFGRPAKGMPTWGNLLTPEQKESIWNYLRARAVGGLQPGRPHLAPGANRDSTAFPKDKGSDSTFVPPFVFGAKTA